MWSGHLIESTKPNKNLEAQISTNQMLIRRNFKKNQSQKKKSNKKISIKRMMIKFEQKKQIKWWIIFYLRDNLKRKVNFTKELKKKPLREWELN